MCRHPVTDSFCGECDVNLFKRMSVVEMCLHKVATALLCVGGLMFLSPSWFTLVATSVPCTQDLQCSLLESCYTGFSSRGHCMTNWPVNRTACHAHCQTDTLQYEREHFSMHAQRFIYFPSLGNNTCAVGFQSVPALNPKQAKYEMTIRVVDRVNLWREWFVVFCQVGVTPWMPNGWLRSRSSTDPHIIYYKMFLLFRCQQMFVGVRIIEI